MVSFFRKSLERWHSSRRRVLVSASCVHKHKAHWSWRILLIYHLRIPDSPQSLLAAHPQISSCSKRQKSCFPPRKGHFLFLFECLPLFLLSLFWPPLFSISLSLSLSCSILFFPSCLFFCFLFVPSFSLFLYLSFLFAFVSWKDNIKTLNCYFFPEFFSLFLVSCLVFLSNPFFLSLFFPDFKLCFLFNINVFGFKKKQSWKTPIFGQKGGLQQNGFFMNLCFAKCESYCFLGCHFCQIWFMFNKHCKNRYFSTFLKAKKQKYHFEVLLSGPSRCYYLGQLDCNLKMTNLAQIITPQIRARNFFSKKKVPKPLLL